MKVLVLGAGGFLGTRVMAALQRREGILPVAGLRARASRPAPAGIEVRTLDATERNSVHAALEGMTHVVNCVMAAPDPMHRGVDVLVEAALHRNIRRLVHISSIAIYGTAEGLLDETSPPGDGLDAYARSKLDSEQLIRKAMERGLDAVTLRPGLIYGPGSEAWTTRIGTLLRQKRLGDLGAEGDGFCNLVHVDDVAAAIVAALTHADAHKQSFNLADPDPPRWNDYLKAYARALGVPLVPRIPGRQLRLETRALAVPLKVAEKLGGRLGLRNLALPPAITPSLAAVMRQEIRFRPDRTDALLRLPRTPWRRGVDASANWYLHRV